MENSILKGLKNAFDQNNYLQGFDFAELKPEYLLNYEIANQIKKDFNDYRIKLEDSTDEFKKSAFHPTELIENTKLYSNWDITRKGRIDIAVYNSRFQSICPIEVKLVNPNKKRILADIVRLKDFLKNVNTGTISSGYFIYVYKKRIFTSLDQINSDICFARKKASKIIKENFDDVTETIDIKACIDSIGNYSNFNKVEEMEGYEPIDLGELIRENIHYIGVIIKLEKKSNNG